MSPPLLTLSGVCAGYAPQSTVLSGVDMEVRAGQIVCLLGRNGAGKSTTIKTICGLLRPTSGSIVFDGQDITRSNPAAIVALGIAVVPEGRRVFASLSVEENLLMGAYSRRNGIVPRAPLDEIHALFPRLAERRNQLAGTLSGGEQQMLAIGRALMSQPRLLLLDEPSMGLAPILIETIFDTINTLAASGITVLLVEQNAVAALDVSDHAYVLERGRIVQSDLASVLEQTEDIQTTYLGS